MHSIFQNLIKDYNKYYESSIKKRRFKHEDIIHLIKKLEGIESFSVKMAGRSFQGREIFCVDWGKGPRHILMWSQMHGDESTATRAIFDIWNFLISKEDGYEDIRRELSDNICLHFLPVLNPDGTNQWQRRNLQGIDMNRDAVRLQTPEARILKSLCDKIKPHFGFNLHDQSLYYSAGNVNNPATISFLSPAYNVTKDINEVREMSMKLICHLNQHVQKLIPGHVGKYDDTFNPRAFGDNIQKWGISTILVESGGYPNDPEKEFIRKINFALILEAAFAIARNSFSDADIKIYESIPFNKKEHFLDLIIRNAAIKRNGIDYKVDIAINREEIDYNNHRDFYYIGKIVDIGDMSAFYGYEEVDLNGMEVEYGNLYPYIFDTHEEVHRFDLKKILSNGYTSIVVEDALLNEQFTGLPLNIQIHDREIEKEILLGDYANLVVREEGEVKLTIVNGFIFKPEESNLGIKNGLVLNP